MSRPSAIPVRTKNLVGKRQEHKLSNVIIFSFLLTTCISLSFPFLSFFFKYVYQIYTEKRDGDGLSELTSCPSQ